MPTFSLYEGDRNCSQFDVVFLHGLGGRGHETWLAKGLSAPWPTWLVEEDERVAIWFVDYAASPLRTGSSMTIRDRTVSLLSALSTRIGQRPFVLVGHSLGGLLIKMMVEHCDTRRDDLRHVMDKLVGVVFMATPHAGSDIADVATKFAPELFSSLVGDLESNAENLNELGNRYRDFATEQHLPHLIFAERKLTKRLLSVVSVASSDPNIPFHTVVPVDADHIDICKLHERDDPVYLRIRDFLNDCFATQAPTSDPLADSHPSPVTIRPAPSEQDLGAHGQSTDETSGRQTLSAAVGIERLRLRFDAVEHLNTQLDHFKEQQLPVAIAITGTGGVGKTTLAHTWAHDLIVQGHFSRVLPPLKLNGYRVDTSTSRTSTEVALELLLRYLNKRGIEVPADDLERAELYRKTLAESEEGLIIILDNAENAAQIEALLPPPGKSFAIITSRNPLDLFSMPNWARKIATLKLNRLDREASLKFLEISLGVDAVEAERDAAETLCRICVGLPLALSLAAVQIEGVGTEEANPIATVVARLNSAGSLDALHATDLEINLRAIFDASLNHLEPNHRILFGRLSLRSPQGIDALAVSLLGDTDLGSAQRAIIEFESVGLLENKGDRYQLHDLLHSHSDDCFRNNPEEQMQREVVRNRLLRAYCACVNYEFDRVNPNNTMIDRVPLKRWLEPETQRIVDRYPKGKWVDRERDTLISLAREACDGASPSPYGPRLAYALFYYLDTGGWWTEWDLITQGGLLAARRLGDVLSEARLLRNAGRVHLVRARDWLSELRDDQDDEAGRLAAAEDCLQAIGYFQQSSACYAAYNAEPTSTTEGRPCPGEAVVVLREVTDTNLKLAQLEPGRISLGSVIDGYNEVKAYYASNENLEQRDNALASLSVSLSEAHRLEGSLAEAQASLDAAFRYTRNEPYKPEDTLPEGEIRHPRNDSFALVRQAELYIAKREPGRAARAHQEAAAGFAKAGNAIDRARALANCGRVLAETGYPDAAASDLELAYHLFSEKGSRERHVVDRWLAKISRH